MQMICDSHFNACHIPPQGFPNIISKAVAGCRYSVRPGTAPDWFHKILLNMDELTGILVQDLANASHSANYLENDGSSNVWHTGSHLFQRWLPTPE